MSQHIVYLDPYHTGSHAAVARGYAAHSSHRVTLFTMPMDGGWRWRMRGAAITMAEWVRALPEPPDCIVTTDMLDVATFRALYGPTPPITIYFHENQLTYPIPHGRTRDESFGWINYTSALVADRVVFNSGFHRTSFLQAITTLLRRHHDYRALETVEHIANKSYILPPGIDLTRHDHVKRDRQNPSDPPTILWNSRWEYDKQPAMFFAALEALEEQGCHFRLIFAGEAVNPNDPAFLTARARWQQRTIHWGYAQDPLLYSQLLHQADIVVSTAIQEFFGIGVLEAIYCGCIPLLPNRLSYPEIIPRNYHTLCLYTDYDDLVAQLKQTIESCHHLQSLNWRAIAAPYDWKLQAQHYDKTLFIMNKVTSEL